MTIQQERKNKRIALISTIGVHLVVLLLLLFVIAWKAPNPPHPEYGIELNFGMDNQGSGEEQTSVPVAQQEEEVEEIPEETTPEPIEETVDEDIVEEQVTEDPKPADPEIVSKVESPVVVKEEKKEEVKPVEKPKEKPTEKPAEKTPEPKPKEEPKAVYNPNANKSTAGKTSDQAGTPSSQGDSDNKPGDKGDPEGTLDAKAQYGKQGGGGGGVSMSGFNGFEWPQIKTPALPDEAFGVYEFIVKVDDQGDVISVTSAQRGLSIEAERRLKAEIQRLQFVPKGSNLPAQSEGKITFKVVSTKN